MNDSRRWARVVLFIGLPMSWAAAGYLDNACAAASLRSLEPGTVVSHLPNQLQTIDDQSFPLGNTRQSDWTVFCFMGTECPLAKLYTSRLQKLADSFADDSVRFVAVFSNQQDSFEEVAQFVDDHGLRFAAVYDRGNQLADCFAARRTPEVFVLDGQLRLRYRGRIDDQYTPGIIRSAPRRQDLREALKQLTDGDPVAVPTTEPEGCLIGRVQKPVVDSGVTYCNQISRLLNRHCIECHRAGELGPFALTDYDEVVGWAEMINEVVQQQRMPPWHASQKSMPMDNARRLMAQEKQLIADWVADGAPFGDAAQLPKQPDFVSGWQLPRKPDLVLPMRNRPFTVPAEGVVEYQYFVVDPGFEEDRWVLSAQAIPGNHSVVHHIIVFVRPPDMSEFRGVGWVAAYVPGQRVPQPLPHHARRIPAGSKLVFQMHYTPMGEQTTDLSRVGLVFAEAEDVQHELYTVIGIDQGFEIPPHEPAYTVEGQVKNYPRSGRLLSIMPHMHFRGKAFQLWARREGRRHLLLDVPRYDFNWQHIYQLADPMPLADVDSLDFRVTFDNSTGNPFNPDPTQMVTWGDQTWEEMAVAFLEVARPLASEQDGGPADSRDRSQPAEKQRDKKVAEQTQQFLDDFFNRFDRNGDGLVQYDETPLVFRRFAFGRYDLNRDRRLSYAEVEPYARSHFARR